MDIRIFNELKRRGVITSPFLKADMIKDINELYAKGYATSPWAKNVYNDIVKSLNIEETAEPTEVITPAETKETKPEPTVKSTSEPTPKVEETAEPAEVKEDIIVDEGDDKNEETNKEESAKTKSSKK